MNECLMTPQHKNRSAVGCQNKVGRGGGNVLFNDALNKQNLIYGYMASYIWLRTILIVRKGERE